MFNLICCGWFSCLPYSFLQVEDDNPNVVWSVSEDDTETTWFSERYLLSSQQECQNILVSGLTQLYSYLIVLMQLILVWYEYELKYKFKIYSSSMHICDMGKLIILHSCNIWFYQIINWFTENNSSAIRASKATCRFMFVSSMSWFFFIKMKTSITVFSPGSFEQGILICNNVGCNHVIKFSRLSFFLIRKCFFIFIYYAFYTNGKLLLDGEEGSNF